MGKRSCPDFDGPMASVDFAMEWAASASKEDLAYAKQSMQRTSSVPPEKKGATGGGKSLARTRIAKKTTKKKR